MLALGVAALWCGATLDAPAGSGRRYDAIVLGTGLQESLLSGVLASQGKRVLCLERRAQLGGETPCLDLKELLTRALGDGSPLPKGVGDAADYAIDVAPKAALASSSELQLLVSSGLWRKMDWRRVHRSFIYRRKDDGSPDVHRVPSNSEDLLKTRMMLPMDKARALQMYQWLEKFDEEDESTYVAGKLNKRKLNLHKMSALAFLRYWELDKYALLLTRGMAGYLPSADGPKRFKRMAAIELVRAMKSYKDAFRTFPHMTSPYLYPSGGLASSLATAASAIVSEKGGETRLSADVDEIIFDGAGRACGVRCGGEEVKAETVVASAPYVPDRVEPAYQARVLAVACPTTTAAPLPLPPTLFRTEPQSPTHVTAAAGGAAIRSTLAYAAHVQGLALLHAPPPRIAHRPRARHLPVLHRPDAQRRAKGQMDRGRIGSGRGGHRRSQRDGGTETPAIPSPRLRSPASTRRASPAVAVHGRWHGASSRPSSRSSSRRRKWRPRWCRATRRATMHRPTVSSFLGRTTRAHSSARSLTPSAPSPRVSAASLSTDLGVDLE